GGWGAGGDRCCARRAWNGHLNMPGKREFEKPYRKAYPSALSPPANEQLGQGYVCGMIIRQALEKAASRDSRKIRDVLATAEFTNLPYPNPTVKFGPDGLNVNNKEVLAEWINSHLPTVWPKDVQTVAPLL